MTMMNNITSAVTHEPTGNILDITSVLVILAAFTDILPPIATFFTILWLAIRIWESETIRIWTNREKEDQDDQDED